MYERVNRSSRDLNCARGGFWLALCHLDDSFMMTAREDKREGRRGSAARLRAKWIFHGWRGW